MTRPRFGAAVNRCRSTGRTTAKAEFVSPIILGPRRGSLARPADRRSPSADVQRLLDLGGERARANDQTHRAAGPGTAQAFHQAPRTAPG